MSLREYLLWEETSGGKHEYYRGEIFAMAGTTIRHNRITGNIYARLHQLLQGGECEPFGSDQRIYIAAADLGTYPDVSVVCGGVQTDRIDTHGITNPRVIVEVLSKSTENYDRGPKFELYQKLASFAEYVVVYQTEPKIIHFIRQADGTWKYRLIVGLEAVLRIESIQREVSFAEIYSRIEFGPEHDSSAALPRPTEQ
jgi:Uma2 family endonuclease